jgi:hypothetical protein
MQAELGWHPGIDLETGVKAAVAAIIGRAPSYQTG